MKTPLLPAFLLAVSALSLASLKAADARPLKVLLITGGCCHDYSHQKDILKAGLEERANVVVTQIHTDDRSTRPPLPIYGNPDYAKGYDVIIHDECSAEFADLGQVADKHASELQMRLNQAVQKLNDAQKVLASMQTEAVRGKPAELKPDADKEKAEKAREDVAKAQEEVTPLKLARDEAVVNDVLRPHRDGIPGVNLHCAMHCYRIGNPNDATTTLGTPHSLWFEYIGLQSSGHGPQEPIEVTYVDPEHPVTKGFGNWTTIKEEHYNNIKIFETAHPLAHGKQTVKSKKKQADGTETVEEKVNDFVDVWTNLYNGKTRVFSTTLGHNNETVADGKYLDLVTRGVLWACDKLDAEGRPKTGYDRGGK